MRAYATNSSGTGYGGAYQITTFAATPNVTDIDGNVYHTITIGTQTWMVENLKTTKYNDGTAIPLVTNNTTWGALSTPAYCWYNNDAATYKNTYGALYNWYAVNIAKLAPTGWHMPTQTEWQTLEGVIGNDSTKNNSSGFSATLGGARYDDGTFSLVGVAGYWWSSTEHFTGSAWMGSMGYSTNFLDMFFFYSKQYGFSVRCLRD